MSDPLYTKEYADVIRTYRWGNSKDTEARVASRVWIALCHAWTNLSQEQRLDLAKDWPPEAKTLLDLLPTTPRKRGQD